MNRETIYTERGAITPLQNGKAVWVRGVGNSMTPILKSKDIVFVEPVTDDMRLEKGDIVLVKVHGNVYLHKITAVKGQQEFQISNNHGHVNGWAPRRQVYGIVTILPV
jgi:phage repressor protein C with HTH and peptisase S24 domain